MAEKTNGKGSIYPARQGQGRQEAQEQVPQVAPGRVARQGPAHRQVPPEGQELQRLLHPRHSASCASSSPRSRAATSSSRNGWTFNGYAKHYVDTRVAAGEIQERTANSLRGTLKALGYRIGELRLQEITPEVIEAAYIDLRAGESLSGKPLSGRTLYNINLSAYLMFQNAKEKGIVGENPLEKVPMPNEGHQREGVAVGIRVQRPDLGARPGGALPVRRAGSAPTLGLRRSESLGLSWGDVDFAQRHRQRARINPTTTRGSRSPRPRPASGFCPCPSSWPPRSCGARRLSCRASSSTTRSASCAWYRPTDRARRAASRSRASSTT